MSKEIKKVIELMETCRMAGNTHLFPNVTYYAVYPEKFDQALTKLRSIKAPEPKCKTCGGSGKVPTKASAGFGPENAIMQTCPDCQQPIVGDWTKIMREKWLPKPINIDRILSEAVSTIAVACNRLDRAEAINKDLLDALEQSKEIFSKRMRSLREKEEAAKDNLAFVESRYWGGVYYQIFELRHEIERMLSKKNLNEFCILMAFIPEDKREKEGGEC